MKSSKLNRKNRRTSSRQETAPYFLWFFSSSWASFSRRACAGLASKLDSKERRLYEPVRVSSSRARGQKYMSMDSGRLSNDIHSPSSSVEVRFHGDGHTHLNLVGNLEYRITGIVGSITFMSSLFLAAFSVRHRIGETRVQLRAHLKPFDCATLPST